MAELAVVAPLQAVVAREPARVERHVRPRPFPLTGAAVTAVAERPPGRADPMETTLVPLVVAARATPEGLNGVR